MPCWIALHTSITTSEPGGAVLLEAAVQRAVAGLALGFTPHVALVDEVVLMDVTGSLRLFGGLARLMQRLAQQLAEFFESNRLVAHTTRAQGATSLIATGRLRMVAGANQSSARQHSGESAAAGSGPMQRAPDARRVADLPMHTLSAALPHLGVLERIGCRTWGDLLALPRDGAARRFGAGLFDALDRARGQTPDNHDWLTLPEQFDEKIELDALVTQAPALMAGAERLLLQLHAWLLGRQSGLTALRLIWHFDKRRDVAPTGEFDIRTANPAQDLRHVARLLAEHLAQQKLAAPVHSLRLQSLETHKLADSAAATGSLLFEAQYAGCSATELIERLSARLGDASVLAWGPQADHRPEQMQRWTPARSTSPVAIKSGAARARFDWAADRKSSKIETQTRFERTSAVGRSTSRSAQSGRSGRVDALYPSWLLFEPMALATFGNSPMYQGRLQRLAGPQRLEATGWAASRSDASGLLQSPSLLPPNHAEGRAEGLPAAAVCAPSPSLLLRNSEKNQPAASAVASAFPSQAPAIRDYFIYRNQQGALLWIYRERLAVAPVATSPLRSWYLHGFFA